MRYGARMTDPSPRSPLGRALAGKQAGKLPSRFAQAIAGARVYEPWVVPRLGIECAITLLPFNRAEEIDGAVNKRMVALGLSLADWERRFDTARAVRYAAEALVSREEPHDPIGTLDEWLEVDTDVIAEFWRAYGDVREAYDPVDAPLTEEEVAWIVEGIKKKEARLLRLCGVRRLATFLLSTEGQLSSLATPSFGATSSPPAISGSTDTRPSVPATP